MPLALVYGTYCFTSASFKQDSVHDLNNFSVRFYPSIHSIEFPHYNTAPSGYNPEVTASSSPPMLS